MNTSGAFFRLQECIVCGVTASLDFVFPKQSDFCFIYLGHLNLSRKDQIVLGRVIVLSKFAWNKFEEKGHFDLFSRHCFTINTKIINVIYHHVLLEFSTSSAVYGFVNNVQLHMKMEDINSEPRVAKCKYNVVVNTAQFVADVSSLLIGLKCRFWTFAFPILPLGSISFQKSIIYLRKKKLFLFCTRLLH